MTVREAKHFKRELAKLTRDNVEFQTETMVRHAELVKENQELRNRVVELLAKEIRV